MTSISAMLKFIDDEITGLKARIGTAGNDVQRAKLAMLSAIRRELVERRNASAA